MRTEIFIERKAGYIWNKLLTLLLFFSFLIFTLNSCSTQNEDSGKFYEGNYTDEIVFKSDRDTINIVIEQINLAPNLTYNIPYSNVTSNLTDTTKLKLFVSYGNFNPEKPNVFVNVNQLNDTIYIWYANREPSPKMLAKNSSVNQAEPIPPPAYVRIDSIVAYSTSKTNIISRIVK